MRITAAVRVFFLGQDREVFNSKAVKQDQAAPHTDGNQPFPDTREVAAAHGLGHACEHHVHPVEYDTDDHQDADQSRLQLFEVRRQRQFFFFGVIVFHREDDS